jgi:hypothetical protein
MYVDPTLSGLGCDARGVVGRQLRRHRQYAHGVVHSSRQLLADSDADAVSDFVSVTQSAAAAPVRIGVRRARGDSGRRTEARHEGWETGARLG